MSVGSLPQRPAGWYRDKALAFWSPRPGVFGIGSQLRRTKPSPAFYFEPSLLFQLDVCSPGETNGRVKHIRALARRGPGGPSHPN